MDRLLISLCLLIFSNICFSQKLYKGRAVSALTGSGLKGALIERSGKLVADTDSLGYFSLELDSTNNIALDFSTIEVGNISIGGLHFKKDEVLLISLLPDCLYSSSKDRKQDEIKLLMAFTAFSPQLTKSDRAFEKKYKLQYYGYGEGCTGIVVDCIETYNKAIAAFLDKKYGKSWRKEVNKGVTGL
jgi:hypothetical protein